MLSRDYDYGVEPDPRAWESSTYAPDSNWTPDQVADNPSSSANLGVSEVVIIGTLLQSIQHTLQQQMTFLHQLEQRISAVEQLRSPTAANTPSGWTAWWVVWGFMMLIFGVALGALGLLLFYRLV